MRIQEDADPFERRVGSGLSWGEGAAERRGHFAVRQRDTAVGVCDPTPMCSDGDPD